MLLVFKTRVLRKTFRPKRYKVTGQCRRLHDEELYDLYSSPNIVWLIKSRKAWVWHGCRFWCRYRMETYHLEKPRIDGRIILKRIFKWHREARAGLLRPTIRIANVCECGNEPSSSIKFGKFLTTLLFLP